MQGGQFILQGERGLRGPQPVARQLLRGIGQQSERQPLAQLEVEPCRVADGAAVGFGGQCEIAGRGQRLERRGAAGESGRRAHRLEGGGAFAQRRAFGFANQVRVQVAQFGDGSAELRGRGGRVERLWQAAQGPLDGAHDEALRGDQHAKLRLGPELPVECLDVDPQVAQLPGVAHDGEGLGDGGGRGAGPLRDGVHEGRAAAIDQRVHDLKRCDLAAQAMSPEGGRMLLLQRRREVAQQFLLQARIVGQVGGQDLLVEVDLGVGQQHAQFRTRQRLAILRAHAHRRRVGQVFDGTVEPALALQRAHEAFEAIMLLGRLALGDADRLALLVVVTQHQGRDFVGHGEEQRIARLDRERPRGDGAAGRDLDVDLMVRRVDACRVVERVGVDPASREGGFDATALREAEIGALADHARAHLRGIDADGIVGAVAGIGVGLAGRLHIGADAAEIEEVDRRRQDGAQQVERRHGRRLDAQHRARLGRQRHRLGRPVDDRPAGRQQALVVVHP